MRIYFWPVRLLLSNRLWRIFLNAKLVRFSPLILPCTSSNVISYIAGDIVDCGIQYLWIDVNDSSATSDVEWLLKSFSKVSYLAHHHRNLFIVISLFFSWNQVSVNQTTSQLVSVGTNRWRTFSKNIFFSKCLNPCIIHLPFDAVRDIFLVPSVNSMRL